MEVLGKYKIIESIGRGAMGTVYKGYDADIDRVVALKVIHPHLIEDGMADELLQRFRQEVKAAARCLHQNIVTVFDYGVQDNVPFMVMEYVLGLDLKSLIKMGGSVSIQQASDIIVQVLAALDFAHRQGVVHRDIKPANIMILENGQVKLADFGVARIDTSDLTSMGDMIGTPSYMSPEGLSGRKVDARSDLYTVGVVLLELLTGRRPDVGQIQPDYIELQVQSIKLDDDSRKRLLQVLLKSLDRDADARYQVAERFGNELKAVFAPDNIYVSNHEDLANTVLQTKRSSAASKPLAPEPEAAKSRTGTSATGMTIQPNILKQLERSLATFVGPMSSILVRKNSSTCASVEELIQNLASQIPSETERTEFLANLKSSGVRKQLDDSAVSSATSGSAGGGVFTLSEDERKTIAQALAHYVGPMANHLVKSAAKKSASRDDFLQRLASKIPNAPERDAFLKSVK